MGLYGAEEIRFFRFRGAAPDVDPSELDPVLAADCQNVEFEGENLLKRKGKVKYNSAIPAAAPVRGLAAYYPASGATRKLIAQIGTAIYEDNGSGTFSSVVTGLTGGVPMEFPQYKETLYAGSSVDTLRKRDNTGAWSQVGQIAAPGAALAPALSQTVIEAFDSGTWTVSGSSITRSYDTEIKLQGTGCLKLAFTASGAKGSYVYKAWSAGATVDLSQAEFLVLWYYSERIGVTFQVAVADNNTLPGALDFSKFPSFTTTQKETWVPIKVPLAGIPANSRSASTGLGIKFVDKPSSGGYPVAVYFDQGMLDSGLEPDDYTYYYTYAQYATLSGQQVLLQESNPSPGPTNSAPAQGKITLKSLPPAAGISVSVTASPNSSVTHINVYRYRDQGPFRMARLVRTVGNATATVTDSKSDGALALDDPPELVSGKITPPLAAAYAVVNGRLLAGNVTLSGTTYPSRIYLSRLGFPEEFGSTNQLAQAPNDPTVAGWFDLPEKDPIRRVVEYDGVAVIFCDRSIWTLEGSGWDDFNVRKRAAVGLDARWAVAEWGQLLFFLAADGVRALALNHAFPGVLSTWLISEPFGALLRAIPAAYRKNACMGIDERGRLHVGLTRGGQTVNDAALVFDTRVEEALAPGYDRQRHGWTYYTNWGASLFLSLRRGGGDNGELLAGDPATGQVWTLNQGETDDGSAISWFWKSRATDAGSGAKLEGVYAVGEFGPAVGQTVTATPVLDRVESGTTLSLPLGAATTGTVEARARCVPGHRGRFAQLKLSGSHSVAMQVYSAALAAYRRQ